MCETRSGPDTPHPCAVEHGGGYIGQSEGRNGLCKSLGAMMIQGYEVTKNLLLLLCCVVLCCRAAWPSLMYRLNIHSKVWRSTF